MTDLTVTVVVLGAQVMADGRPSTALRRRAEHGAAVWAGLAAGSGLIACGGVGDGLVSEASVIAGIAVGRGVPQESITLEERSHNTREQAAEVAGILSPGATVVIVSDSYHLPRATYLMRRAGLDATSSGCGRGAGSAIKWWLGAAREVPAFVKDLFLDLVGRKPRPPRSPIRSADD
ncbi:YdcF family protein [bacterium]|nr:YdcF family protein [bacterium]